MDLEAELDRLFQLPLAAFTAERNALAKRLRATERAEEAARVQALRKPPVSAWAINRLAQTAPDLFAKLRAAGEALRAAQQEGQGHKEALGARRRAVGALAVRAEEVLAEAGHAASAATLLRITKSLEALAIYGEAGSDPPAGRLTEDLEPPGVEALTVFGVARPATGSKRKGTAKGRTAPAKQVVWGPRRLEDASGAGSGRASGPGTRKKKATSRQRAQARKALEEERQHLSERRRAARLAEERLRRAVSVEEQARRALGEAERALEKARQRIAEASAASRDRRREAEETGADLRRAEEAMEAAKERLEELDG